ALSDAPLEERRAITLVQQICCDTRRAAGFVCSFARVIEQRWASRRCALANAPPAWGSEDGEGAVGLAAAAGAVGVAVVALFAEGGVDDAVAAAAGPLAAEGAAFFAVLSAVLAAEIALLAAVLVHDAVAAERSEQAGAAATAVDAVLVVGTVVALLAGSHDAVAALRLAHRAGGAEAGQGELVVRLTRVAVGVEDGDLVGVADLEPEVCHGAGRNRNGHVVGDIPGADRPGCPGCRQVDLPLQSFVRSAHVEHELAVDEHPHVVVAEEGERLTPDVAE